MNKFVILTRDEKSNLSTVNNLSKSDINFFSLPLYEVVQLFNHNLKEVYDWFIFTSKNSITSENLSLVKNAKIACIGRKTERLINSFGYKVSYLPESPNEESFCSNFINQMKDKSQKICLLHGNTSSLYIYDYLNSRDLNVKKILTYQILNKTIKQEQEIELINFIENALRYEESRIMISLFSVNAAKLFLENDNLFSYFNNHKNKSNFSFVTIGKKTENFLNKYTELKIFNFTLPDIEKAILES